MKEIFILVISIIIIIGFLAFFGCQDKRLYKIDDDYFYVDSCYTKQEYKHTFGKAYKNFKLIKCDGNKRR